MKSKFLKYALLSVACSFGGANAGLIVDTTDDSFIDNGTGLEWMDFGVNNNYSYQQVTDLLSSTYSGWRLATESEVVTMWDNAFASDASNLNISTMGVSYSVYLAQSDSFGQSAFNETFDIMGYNSNPNNVKGWFEDSTGSFSYAQFLDYNIPNQIAVASIYGRDTNLDYALNLDNSAESTMLVRNVSIPEPSTLVIFALGMIGLTTRHFKRKS